MNIKALFSLILSIWSAAAYTQHTDTTLLAGKWNLYAIRDTDGIRYRDSIERDLALDIRAAQRAGTWSPADSVNTVAYLHEQHTMKFLSYIRFDSGRHRYSMFIPMAGSETPGSYEWTSDGRLIITLGGKPQQPLPIQLSPTEMTLKLGTLDMIYTREKPW